MINFILNQRLRSKSVLGLTIVLLALNNIGAAQVSTHVWTPSVGAGPAYAWSVPGNWRDALGNPVATAPGPASIVEFNSGNSTCFLDPAFGPTTYTIAGLKITNSFDGTIDLNSTGFAANTLRVVAAGPTDINGANFVNGGAGMQGTLRIESNFQVNITGINTALNLVLDILMNSSGVSLTVDQSVLNGNLIVDAFDNITLSNTTFNRNTTIIKRGNNPCTLLPSANTYSSIGGFTTTLRNSGTGPFNCNNVNFNRGLIIDNTAGGDINTDLLISKNLTITNSGTGTVTIDEQTANGSVTMTNSVGGTIRFDRGTVSGDISVTNNNAAGTTWLDRTIVNGNLTITRNAGTINACRNGLSNCKLGGNLTVNGLLNALFTFGDGTPSSGALEFIGNNNQTVTRGGNVQSPLTFTKIVFNKATPKTVTFSTNADVTQLATMTKGVIVSGANTIKFATPAIVSGFGNDSFVDGLVGFGSAGGSVTFPTGNAPQIMYRPVTVNFAVAEGSLSNITARYFKSAAVGAVNAPVTRVSGCEFWTVNATPATANSYTVTLPWKGADCADPPNYISDLPTLIVSRFAVGAWQNHDGTPGGASTPAVGTITSNPIITPGVSIGNLTIGTKSLVPLDNPLQTSNKTVWTPTVADPEYKWSNPLNWSRGVPDATKIAVFDVGNTTSVLPLAPPFPVTTITVGGLETAASFTGQIDINGNILLVAALGQTDLHGGTIFSTTNGSGNVQFQINTNFLVKMSDMTFGRTVVINNSNSSGVNLSTNNTFLSTVVVRAQDNIALTGNTFNSSATIENTGGNFSISGLSAVNTFASSPTATITIRNSGAGSFGFTNAIFNRPMIVDNTTTGSITTDMLASTNLTVTNLGTGSITIDRHTASGNAIVTSSGGGTISFDRSSVNGNLTLRRNNVGSTINACFTGNCQLGGNLVVDGTTAAPLTIGNGTGTFEFIGTLPQTITRSGSVPSLSFTNLILNKTIPETITTNTDISITSSATMTKGILVSGNNKITFANPGIVSGYGNSSFVDGWVEFTQGTAVTFFTGNAFEQIYRPITINFAGPDNGITKSARYYRSVAPNGSSLTAPLTNVSAMEYWSVNAMPSNNFTTSLTWNNVQFNNSFYVQDVSKLKVSRFNGTSWVSHCPAGGCATSAFLPFSPLAPPDAGTITSNNINPPAGTNVGDITLGSTDIALNYLADLFKWQPTVADPTYRWNNGANWSSGTVPTATSIPVFLNTNTTCVLPSDVTVGGLRLIGSFGGAIDMNGNNLTINATGSSILSTGSIIGVGSFVVNSGGYGVNISGITVNPPLTISGQLMNISNTVFNGDVSITKTGVTTNSWLGGNTFNANTDIVSNGGALQLSTANPDSFKNLTLTQNSGTLNACYTANCLLSGNLTMNGTNAATSIGNGTSASGGLEFVGSNPQTLSVGGAVTSFSFPKISLNKSAVETITASTDITITNTAAGSAVLTRGILALSNEKIITLNSPSAISGANSGSFIDGWVKYLSASGGTPYPVGSAAAKIYRPVRVNWAAADGTLSNVSAKYYKATPPFVNQVNGVDHVSRCEYWDLRGRPARPFTVELSWNGFDCTGDPNDYVDDFNKLVVTLFDYWDTQRYRDNGQSAITGTTTAGTITSDPINLPNSTMEEIGYITLAAKDATFNSLLPVELTEFSAARVQEGVRLHWVTASETSNDHFEIQRTGTELNFIKIGEVQGHGTTHERNIYSLIDTDPLQGVAYYRLKQVDFDGTFSYSNIISIESNREKSKFAVFPVPASSGATLHLSERNDVKVFDQAGKLLFVDYDVREISLERFKPGLYIIKNKLGETCRFIVY